MANNSISALNTGLGNTAVGNSATNVSVPDATANAGATNSAVTASTDPAKWVADYCAGYGQTLLWLAIAFLAVALLLGLVSSIIALRAAEAQGGGHADLRDNVLPDPGKLVDALKGLIDALAKAPAWIAIFVGGILLLWMAGSYADAVCVPSEGQENSAASKSANSTRTTANTTITNTQRTDAATVTGNTQATGTNAQSRPGG